VPTVQLTRLRRDVLMPAARHGPRAGAAAAALTLGLGVCGAVAVATPALATSCSVKDGTHSYTDLQTAVNAAHKGDTLKVSGTCSDAPGGDGHAVTIATSLTIDGASGATVKPSPVMSGGVFEIATGTTVTLHGLTITGGGGDIPSGGGILNLGKLTASDDTVTGNTQTVDGAGIYNGSGATLALTGTTVSDDDTSSGNGGGIYNNEGTVTLTGSTVEDDNAGDGLSTGTGQGGGIYNYTGTVTLTGSTVYFNAGTQGGGGIYNASASTSDGGSVTLDDDTLVANDADYGNGGGVFNDGNLTLTGTTVTMNDADSGSGHGGGVYSAPDWNLIATNSTVSGNTAEYGGGVYNDGTSRNPGFASLSDSTVSGNQAEQAGGGLGNEGDMTLVNSTVASNSDVGSAGGIFSDAGSTLALAMVTVSDNSGYAGGGLYNDGALTVAGTIIAGNTASQASPDCDQASGGSDTDNGYNLTGNNSGCFKPVSTDITDTAAVLGSLASNGGPTQTLLPLVGSPAINAIPTATCESAAFLNSTHPADQRGVSRPQGGACEIGSVEVAAPVITKFSPTSGKPGTKVTITGHHFSGTDGVTAVYIAGFSSSFKIVSATKITATVPSRAKTGPIKVTAAGGSFTTTTKFKVT
jgi:fibronectin-binding autotransporter adhesin